MNAPLDASLLHYQAMKDDFTVDLKDWRKSRENP